MPKNSIGPSAHRNDGAPKLLIIEQHGEMGGGQRISLSLVTHPLFQSSVHATFGVPEEGPFSDRLRAAGFNVHVLPKFRVRNGPKSLSDILVFCAGLRRQYRWLVSKLDQDNCDAIYTSSPRYLLPAVIACATRKKPLYFHVHCFYRRKYQELFLRILFSSKWVSGIFCPSHASYKWVRTSLRRTRNVHYVPNWIPEQERSEVLGIPKKLPSSCIGSFKVGIVGRIVRLKGHDVFLHAFERLLADNVNVEAYIIGSEIYEEGDAFAAELRQRYSEFPRIHFMGQLHPMAAAYEQLSCVVVPSRTEVFGLVAIEAMQMRVPLIVSDIDELPFIVANGRCGVIFKANDVDGLVSAMKVIINDSALRATLTEAAYDRIQVMYNRERSVASIVQSICMVRRPASIAG